jgi:hypothetical protein
MSDFRLHPFPTERIVPQVEILGTIDRDRQNILSIEYHLQGDLNSVAIASPALTPSRKFELWESTCCELFIGVPGKTNYWEFNLSPSGDWNVFYLDDYRQGLRNETAFTSLPLAIDRQANALLLKLTLDLTKIIPLDRNLEVSVTTVIESTAGEMSYWALTHAGTKADFHQRDSFIINL